MAGPIQQPNEFFPIQGIFEEKAKTFKVGDVIINKIATGKFGQLQKVFGKAFEMKVTSEGKERTIYVRKSEAKKILEFLQKPEQRSGTIREAFTKTLLEQATTIAKTKLTPPPELEHIEFTPQDLITLKAAAESTGGTKLPPDITVDGKIYTLNTAKLPNDRFQFIIQEKDADPKTMAGKLSLTIDSEGKIVSVEVDNIPSNELPEEGKKIFNAYFLLSLESSTKFVFENNGLYVSALPRSPQQLPLPHLKFLGDSLEKSLGETPDLDVQFLNDDLTDMEGVDRGGVRRAYLDQLFTGAAQHMLLQPFSTTKAVPGESLANVRDHRNEYEALGRTYWLCWESPSGLRGIYDTNLLTGAHFSDDLFKLVFSLSFNECSQPLSTETRKRLNDLFLQSASGKANQSLAALSFCRDERNVSGLLGPRFDKSQLIPGDKLGTYKTQLEEKRALLRTLNESDKQGAQKEIDDLQEVYDRSSHLMEMCTTVAYLENTPFAQMDNALIYQKLYEVLQKALVERTDEENELINNLQETLKKVVTDDSIDKAIQNQGLDLEAIRAIGFGMLAQGGFDPETWDTFRKISPSIFSNRVQGEVTNEKIAASIHPEKYLDPSFLPLPLKERIEWVKEWLTKEASEEEAKQFLKWATGATGLTPRGITFRLIREIRETRGPKKSSPYPTAHTCESIVDFYSPEDVVLSEKKMDYFKTKQGFIGFLKEAMQNVDFSLV